MMSPVRMETNFLRRSKWKYVTYVYVICKNFRKYAKHRILNLNVNSQHHNRSSSISDNIQMLTVILLVFLQALLTLESVTYKNFFKRLKNNTISFTRLSVFYILLANMFISTLLSINSRFISEDYRPTSYKFPALRFGAIFWSKSLIISTSEKPAPKKPSQNVELEIQFYLHSLYYIRP